MRLITYLMAATMALTSVEAVTSRHYTRSFDCTDTGTYTICRDLPANTCCTMATGYATSVLMTGLPPTAIGGMYEGDFVRGCASNVKAGSGLSLCLYTGSRVNLAGSEWFDILQCGISWKFCPTDAGAIDFAKAESELLGTAGNCTNTVEPDILAMGDGTFYHIGDGVPQDKVDKLFELAEAYDVARETQTLDAESEINVSVADELVEFRVREEDIDPEWL